MTTQTVITATKSAENRRNELREKLESRLSPLTVKNAIGNQAMLRMRARPAPAPQTKLQINEPGDIFEQEADSMADRVMRMPDPPNPPRSSALRTQDAIQRRCSCGGEGGECAACAEKKEEAGLQRCAAPSGLGTSPRGGFAPPIVHQVLNSAGHPLDPATRHFMEARFDQNFGRVRVHADFHAAESARSVSALAYTVGSNIVFGRGMYSPGTEGGRRLLAHELTHVVQQGPRGLTVQREEAKFDVDGAAAQVEGLVCVKGQEGVTRDALVKLDGIADVQNLLDVTAKLYDNYETVQRQDPQPCRAFPFLNSDLTTGQEKAGLAADRLQRLIGAFEAAKVHKQRNPRFKDDPEATKPTLSQARDRSKSGQPARVGDWGEDPAGNTWVMHSEGIRTYWTSSFTRDSGKRSSQWLGKNVGNFGGNRAVAHRMISSFKWGKGYDFAIYNDEKDSEADLRENMGKVATVGTYIDKNHLGPGDDRPRYYKTLQEAVKGVDSNVTFDPGDSTQKWVLDNAMWEKLFKAFQVAEGWAKGETIDSSNVKTKSSKPEDAPLIKYYSTPLGVTDTSTPQPSPGAAPPAKP